MFSIKNTMLLTSVQSLWETTERSKVLPFFGLLITTMFCPKYLNTKIYHNSFGGKVVMVQLTV
jgi:hypothetical protein